MPTGYTAVLLEKPETTFKQFAMLCARAFGALVTMRDDDMDAPIPEKFKPSDYYVKRLRESQEEFATLSVLGTKARIQFGKKKQAETIAALEGSIEKEERENSCLEAMAAKVREWHPPSSDHVGLKDFMLEQLKIYKHDPKWFRERISSTKQQNPLDVWQDALDSAKRNIQYFADEMQKEAERVAGRNEWLKQLRDSLKEAANA